MDSERIIPGSIIVLIVIIPIILLKLRTYLRKKKIVGSLKKLAQSNDTSIVKYDQWNNSAIGLSKNGTHLFFVSINKQEEKEQAIKLSAYNKCSLINDKAGAAFKEGNYKVTNSVDLVLTGKSGELELINFYDPERDGSLLTGELELADRWCKIINECTAQRVWLYPETQNDNRKKA